MTQGKSNDFFSKVIKTVHPPYHFENGEIRGVLGEMTEDDIEKVSDEIRRTGFYVFDRKLSEDYCSQLLHFALSERACVRPMKSEGADKSFSHLSVYNRDHPDAVRYDFDEETLINQSAVQDLFCDLTLLAVAQAYLQSQPVIDVTSMWWHTSYLKVPSKEAAQFYHFDMDRIKWLKFFFYLTDVTARNGPHCFIEGSHATKGIPRSILDRGYARLLDEEVQRNYPKEKLIEFTGSRGTIIAEDTRGLHKGKMVESGDRLVFQIQFSNSLFGATYKKSKFKIFHSHKLDELSKKYKRIYSNYS